MKSGPRSRSLSRHPSWRGVGLLVPKDSSARVPVIDAFVQKRKYLETPGEDSERGPGDA